MKAHQARGYGISIALTLILIQSVGYAQTGLRAPTQPLPGQLHQPLMQPEQDSEPTKPRTTHTPPTAPSISSPANPVGAQPRPRMTTPSAPVKPAPGIFKPAPVQPAAMRSMVRVLAPNGNEKISFGTTFQIKWSAKGMRERVNVELAQNGRQIAVVARNVSLAAGTINWSVDENRLPRVKPGSGYKIVLKSTAGKVLDSSDRAFSIVTAVKQKMPTVRMDSQAVPGVAPTASVTGAGDAQSTGPAAPAEPGITIVEPVANDRWCTNDAHEFRWNSTLAPGSSLKVDLMRDGGQTLWQNVTASTPDDGSYIWPGLSDAQFVSGTISLRPRISTLDDSVVVMGDYVHFGKRLLLSKPQSNTTWRKGSQYTIVWSQKCDLPSQVSIELLDAGHQLVSTIASGLSAAGSSGGKSLAWTVPSNLQTGTHYIRVRTSGNEYSREKAFTVDDPIVIPTSTAFTITQPAANSTWCTNESHEFSWSSTLPASSNVRLDLVDGTGQTVWQSIASSTANDGSYVWAGLTDAQFVSGMISVRPRIRSLDNNELTVGGYLHFGKRLMLSAPKANHTWRKGSQYSIVWNQLCTLPSPLQIELLDSSHQLVSTIASGLSTAGSPGNSSRQWTVPSNLNSGTYYMRVKTSGNEYSKESAFTIEDPLQF